MCLCLAGCGAGKTQPGVNGEHSSVNAAQSAVSQDAGTEGNTIDIAETSSDVESREESGFTEASSSTSGNDQKESDDQTVDRDNKSEPELSSEPVYYSMADIAGLEHTENFSKTAIEHIFNGSVNSSGKGSGYHYDMVEDSDGEIIDGTRSEEDGNGIYTAYVEVSGHRKDHYSSFFPDSWSPQDVVDAINTAREDALDHNRSRGSTWIGYFEDIEIDMYLDTRDRIVSAFPVYEDDRH